MASKRDPKDKVGVALVHEQCPVCGKDTNEHIIMNQKLTFKAADEIRSMHNKSVGISHELCDECKKKVDEDNVCFVIGVDEDKSDDNGLFLTGQVFGVSKDSDWYKNAVKVLPNKHFEELGYMYCSTKVLEQTGFPINKES